MRTEEALRLQRREQPLTHVFVACTCGRGAVYPPGGTPIDDDGREFVYDDDEWLCPRCWFAEPGSPMHFDG